MFAAIYVVTFVAVLAVPGKPGAMLGVNPSIAAWVVVLVVDLAHVAILAALVFRYLEDRRRGARSGAPAPAGGSRPPSMTLGSPDLPRC